MSNLLKMERYRLTHNLFYWYGMIGVFLLGLLTADSYVSEVMGPAGGAAVSLADIFNGMVYDSTFLLIIISSLLSLILGQEFSCRTIVLEISAGHSRKTIFAGKIIVCLATYQIRQAVSTAELFQPAVILIGIVWIVLLVFLSWMNFRKSDLK